MRWLEIPIPFPCFEKKQKIQCLFISNKPIFTQLGKTAGHIPSPPHVTRSEPMRKYPSRQMISSVVSCATILPVFSTELGIVSAWQNPAVGFVILVMIVEHGEVTNFSQSDAGNSLYMFF